MYTYVKLFYGDLNLSHCSLCPHTSKHLYLWSDHQTKVTTNWVINLFASSSFVYLFIILINLLLYFKYYWNRVNKFNSFYHFFLFICFAFLLKKPTCVCCFSDPNPLHFLWNGEAPGHSREFFLKNDQCSKLSHVI